MCLPVPNQEVHIRAKALSIVALAALALTASATSAQPSYPATTDNHPVAFHVHRAHVLFQRAYDISNAQVERSEIRKAQAHRQAIRIKKVRLELGAYRDKLKQRWLSGQITPFAGPNGTHWAIPWSVVYCESKGDWDAANPSGAVGPYQLLGHSAPYPAHTPEAQYANHKIAHDLYVSSGLGPWEASRSCWG